jgi:hypothetical protein
MQQKQKHKKPCLYYILGIYFLIATICLLYYYREFYDKEEEEKKEKEINVFTPPYLKPCTSSVIYYNTRWFAGFGSHLNIQIALMEYAHKSGRSFFLVDDDWNYGRWFNYWSSSTYFSIPNSPSSTYFIYFNPNQLHQCALPNKDEIVELEKGLNLNEVPHFKTAVNWGIFDSYGMVVNPSWDDTLEKHEESFKLRSEIIKSLWKLHPDIQTRINNIRNELQLYNYIAIHIRRGDKISELASGEYTPLTSFYNSIEINKQQLNTSKIFVMSDDISIMKNLTEDRPDWEFVSVDGTFNNNVSFNQGIFNDQNMFDRQEDGISLVIQIELMRLADHVICTHSSNICRVISILRGWEDAYTNKHLESLDINWYPG